MSGAISGTKTRSCAPNLTTTLPPPDSTTSPTPNLACRTLSPALKVDVPALSNSPLRGSAAPHPQRAAEEPAIAPALRASGISERKREGIWYSRSPQFERSLA